MSVLRMRIVAGAAALAALVLSVSAASACCGCGGCGYGYQATYYAPVTVSRPVTVYAPVQPTYAVDEGPVYAVPAPTAPEPVPEYVYPRRGYGYGYGRGYGYGYGYGHRFGGHWFHRAAYRARFGGWGRYHGMHFHR